MPLNLLMELAIDVRFVNSKDALILLILIKDFNSFNTFMSPDRLINSINKFS